MNDDLWQNEIESESSDDSDYHEEPDLNDKKITQYNVLHEHVTNMMHDIYKDMNKNDHDNDNFNILMNNLQKSCDIVNDINIGGNSKKGTRLSSLTDDEKKKYKSVQNKFSKQEIKQKLSKFTKISLDELFQIPNGIWVRYFNKDEDGHKGLYRTGGFIIHKDPEQKYITLVAHHYTSPKKKSFTWNIQIDNCYSVYATTKNIRKFRLHKMDKKYNLYLGVSNMLNKWFIINNDLLNTMKINNNSVVYILYDIDEHILHYSSKKINNNKLLSNLDINLDDFNKQLLIGIKNQLNNPIKSKYIVGIIIKNDLVKLKKMKSKIKKQ